ncbi:MAG: bacteriohemerythrin [Bacteroidota bacterium]|jgi:hemerythrin-like metal-binding protein
MSFLEWKDTYNIGVKEIDNQHRGLFDIINKLFTSRLYEPDGKYFYLMLKNFAEYAQVHFSTEERYMREAQYPKFTEHQYEHELFIAQVSQLLLAVEKKEADIENKTLDFLKDWYLAHILGTDRDLEKFFHAHGFK